MAGKAKPHERRKLQAKLAQALRVEDAKGELLVVLEMLERVAVDHGAPQDRQLCAILRTAFIAHSAATNGNDPEPFDVRAQKYLDPLERAAASVDERLRQLPSFLDWGPSGLRPVGARRDYHTVEAEQVVDAMLARTDVSTTCEQLAVTFVDSLCRLAPYLSLRTNLPHVQPELGGFDDAYERVTLAFERLERLSADAPMWQRIKQYERLVIRGLNALGAHPDDTRTLFDARRKKGNASG